MLRCKPGAFPALQETLTDPDLSKFGFAKSPAASQDLVAVRLQGPVGPNLSGMHLSRRDHGLRISFYRQCFTHDDIGASFSLGGREIRLQAKLQPVAAAHSFGGVFGEAETEPGGSVASEPGSQKPVGSISLSRACARVFCSPVWPSKSGIQSSTINF
jgi:hypothetical protein